MWGLGNIRFYTCPISYITQETYDIIHLCYRIEDSKILLFDGGWADQPYWLIEALDISKNEFSRKIKKDKENG